MLEEGVTKELRENGTLFRQKARKDFAAKAGKNVGRKNVTIEQKFIREERNQIS